jgi:crotonobetainyl-CoA:carnitine CoA-transferase CaiB-like acyl-CoA transferase
MTTERALSGIRVLDFSSVIVGPTATLRLADLGAEIIKIEPPTGDVLRSLGGPSPSRKLSGKYLHFNRAKRSVCLDVKKESARKLIHAMLGDCDVLVSNMRPEALKRLELDPVTCRSRHPALIHCTITGFGSNGAYSGRPAYDSVVQGVSGIAGLSLRRDGVPRYAPLVICDHTVGEITASTICAALFQRSRTGCGATLEVPMFETMAAYVLKEHLGAASFHPPLGPAGDTRVLDPNNMPVATADGWISLSANTDDQAAGFLRAIGRPELVDDPRFRNVAARFRNAKHWFDLRAGALKTKPTAHWLAVFAEVDVPAMICHTLESLPHDEHLLQVELMKTEAHPTEGEVTTIRPTILIDGVPAPTGHVTQPLGWDTRSVLTDFGFAEQEIDALIEEGAALDGRVAVELAKVAVELAKAKQ